MEAEFFLKGLMHLWLGLEGRLPARGHWGRRQRKWPRRGSLGWWICSSQSRKSPRKVGFKIPSKHCIFFFTFGETILAPCRQTGFRLELPMGDYAVCTISYNSTKLRISGLGDHKGLKIISYKGGDPQYWGLFRSENIRNFITWQHGCLKCSEIFVEVKNVVHLS